LVGLQGQTERVRNYGPSDLNVFDTGGHDGTKAQLKGMAGFLAPHKLFSTPN